MADANFKEHAQAFELTFPDGTVQRVAKGALSPEAQERIRKQYAPTAPATPLGGATVVPVREPGLTLAPAPAPGPEVPAFPGGVERLPLTATPEEKAAAQQAQEEWLAKYEKPLFGPARPREDAAPAQPAGPAPVDPASLQVFGGQGAPGQVQPASHTGGSGMPASFQARVASSGGVGAPPSGLREMNAANDAQAQAQQQANAAAEAQARAVAAHTDESVRLQTQRLEEAQAKEAERQKAADTQLAEVQKATQALVSEKSAEVNPNRYWANKGTGTKVLASFASFLAGFGGDPIGPIQRSIQQDIELQKEAIQQRRADLKDAVGAQQNLYGLMRQKFGDERMAEAAAMDAGLALAEMQLKGVLARTSVDATKAQGQVALASLADARAKNAVALRQQSYENALKGRQVAIQEAGLQLDALGKTQAAQQAQGELLVPGYGLAMTGKKGAEEGRALLATHEATMDALNRIIAWREKHGAEFTNAKALAELEPIVAMAKLKFKASEQMGTLDKGSEGFLDKLVGDPSRVGNALAQLQALRGMQTTGFQKKLYATTGIQTQPATFKAAQ